MQVVDDVREVSINQIAHTDKRVSKGEYSQMVQSQSDDPDNDRMRHIEINFTDKQQDPNVRHCGSFPIYILPNFLNLITEKLFYENEEIFSGSQF